MIVKNIGDLADYLGAAHDTERSIQRRIYKDTTCGCSSSVGPTEFSVSGYCEGSDAEIAPHIVALPCESEAIDAAIAAADKDGCDMKNRLARPRGASSC